MKTATSPSHLRFRWEGPLAGFMAVALAALLGTGIASAQTASAAGHSTAAMQAVASARPQAAAAPVRHGEDESEAKLDDASHQGIKIHGHWKIDIKNPDGKTVQHREFENAIYTNGTQLLSYLFAGKAVAGEPLLALTTSGTSPCGNAAYSPISGNGCFLYSDPTGYWGGSQFCPQTQSSPYCLGNLYQICGSSQSACSTTLTVTLAAQPHSTIQIQFAGNITAVQSGTIGTVSTLLMVCSDAQPAGLGNGITIPPTTTSATTSANPKSCNLPEQYLADTNLAAATSGTLTYAGTPIAFTGTPITPIPVSAGQTIQASVVISFGS